MCGDCDAGAGGVAMAATDFKYAPTKAGGGGTLKLLWWQSPTLLNPHFAVGTKDQDGSRIFYEPLAAWDPDGNLVPILAAEIPSVEAGTVDNFRHVFFAAQAIVPQMRELGHGSIVNMSSVSWMRGIPLLEAYASAKAAIVGFTNTLARAVGKDRIRVNAIAPGMVLTDRQRRLWFQDESQIEAGRAQQCLPDLIAPEDIANLALFLAADDSRLITKQCISVNGGVL